MAFHGEIAKVLAEERPKCRKDAATAEVRMEPEPSERDSVGPIGPLEPAETNPSDCARVKIISSDQEVTVSWFVIVFTGCVAREVVAKLAALIVRERLERMACPNRRPGRHKLQLDRNVDDPVDD